MNYWFRKKVVYTISSMLILSASLIDQPIMSLRTGGEVATARELIINPNNLKIEGLLCEDRFDKSRLVLLSQDIRDHIKQGLVVDDHEVLVAPEELIRLRHILELHFVLLNKPVVGTHKQRLGKVTDFAIDGDSLYIQKLYVGQNLLKSFSGGTLSVDRSQIIEITDRKIVIQNPLKGVRATTPVSVAPSA